MELGNVLEGNQLIIDQIVSNCKKDGNILVISLLAVLTENYCDWLARVISVIENNETVEFLFNKLQEIVISEKEIELTGDISFKKEILSIRRLFKDYYLAGFKGIIFFVALEEILRTVVIDLKKRSIQSESFNYLEKTFLNKIDKASLYDFVVKEIPNTKSDLYKEAQKASKKALDLFIKIYE